MNNPQHIVSCHSLLLFLEKKFKARRNNRTPIRDFIVGSVIMTQEEKDARKEFLDTHLRTCKVIVLTNDDEQCDDIEAAAISKGGKGNLMLPPPRTGKDSSRKSFCSFDDDDGDSSRPMCAICVAAYEHDDKICWSNNTQCHHCFHMACIAEWLILHEECPCCRLPFLEPEKKRIKEGVVDHQEEAENESDTIITNTERSQALNS